MWSKVRFYTSILEPWRHLHVPSLSIYSLCRSFASYLAVKRTNVSTHSSSACHLFFFLPFSVEKWRFTSLYYLRCALQLQWFAKASVLSDASILAMYTQPVGASLCCRLDTLARRTPPTPTCAIGLCFFFVCPCTLHSLARACGVCGVVWCYGVWCGVVYRVVGTSRLVYSAAILTACRVTPVVHCANRCKVNLPSSSPNTLPLFFFLPLNNCSLYSLLLLQQQPLFSQKRPTCWWQRR